MDKTVDQLYTDVIAVIKKATGLDVIVRGNQDAPQVQGEYASLLMTSQTMNGLPALFTEIAKEDAFSFDGVSNVFDNAPYTAGGVESLLQTVSYVNEATFSLQIFRGDSPMETARRLLFYPASPWGKEQLELLGIAIPSISEPTSSDYKVAELWVKRVTMQLTVVSTSAFSNNVATIGEVTLVVNGTEETVIK